MICSLRCSCELPALYVFYRKGKPYNKCEKCKKFGVYSLKALRKGCNSVTV